VFRAVSGPGVVTVYDGRIKGVMALELDLGELAKIAK
jgi:hypothetical protein